MTANRPDSRFERHAEVLRAIVRVFVESGQPVSSRSVVAAGGLSRSPATIRYVMSELEALGLLAQPHSSAGRVPTEKGFRQYVALVLREWGESGGERSREPSAGLRPGAPVPELMSEASRALSRSCGWVGAVLHPRIGYTRFQLARFLRLDAARIVAVIVGEGGVLADRVVEVGEDYGQDELDRISSHLTNRFRGSTLVEVRRTLESELKEERALCDRLARRWTQLAVDCLSRCDDKSEIVLESASSSRQGTEARMQEVLLAYAEKDRIANLLNRCLEREGMQIVIGAEGQDAEDGVDGLPGVALVAVRYGESGRPLGTVGVVGSTRMRYEEVIPLVDRVARELGAALQPGGEDATDGTS